MKLLTVDASAAPRLAAVHAQSFDRPWSAADLAALIASPGAITLAAEAEGEILGFVLARCIAGEAEILTLAVAPLARRRGLGRALVEALATAVAAESIFLEVAEDNPAAIALYEAVGFVTAGRRPEYYARVDGGRVDARLMRRSLNSDGA